MPTSQNAMMPGHPRVARRQGLFAARWRRAARFCVAVLLLGAVATSVVAEPAPLRTRRWNPQEILAYPGGRQQVDRELYRQGEYDRRWRAIHDLLGPAHVSRLSNEQLARRGLGRALMENGPSGISTNRSPDLGKTGRPDVLRVLIVRVSFESNREPGLTTISPGGDFMLDPLADPAPLEIDPPPHDKAYFEAHLAGLSEYYQFMSGGRLQIEGQVLPAGPTDSYKLSDVADYGPGADGFWSLESLEELVRDMIGAADAGLVADGGNGLADYDDETPFTYVIFVHAGSDWQSDINGDSPNDIPTFFVTLGEPAELIGTNPQGNRGLLSECSIIPETTNQDDFPGSIAAAFYHEFGHALGLPDVYSTETGLPAVGIWDLMDSGTNLPATLGTEVIADGDTSVVVVTATGVLPPSLSVWCKWYLGWVEMGELGSGTTADAEYVLPAVGVPRDQYVRYDNAGLGDFDLANPQAYRAGASPREYFLLENRWVPLALSETPFSDLRLERDEATQVIQYLAGRVKGNWENSGLYDFFMPAGGLLVWHVNADRIASELANNTINVYGDGLRLVEADGIQDIGVLDAYVLGWFGSWRDPFGGQTPEGAPTGFNSLSVAGTPNSLNFDRSFSGLTLSEIGPFHAGSAATMTFKAGLGPLLPGFPWEIAAVDSAEAAATGQGAGPRRIDLDSLTPVAVAGEELLVFADQPSAVAPADEPEAALYALTTAGSPRWAGAPGMPAGAFATLPTRLAGAPVAVAETGDQTRIYWSGRGGVVGATLLTGAEAPVEQWRTTVAEELVAGPLPLRRQDELRLLVAAPDSVYLLASDGTKLGAGMAAGTAVPGLQSGGLAVLPASGQRDADAAIVLRGSGWYLFAQVADGLLPSVQYVPYDTRSDDVPQWFAVVPVADDAWQLRVFAASGQMGAWRLDQDNRIGGLEMLPDTDGPLVGPPAVADLDGDGRDDLLLASAGRVYGFSAGGLPLRGFPARLADMYPLPDSTSLAGPVIVADGTGDGVNEVYLNTDGGHLLGLSATGRILPDLPLRWGDWASSALVVGGDGADRVGWLVSAGGTRAGYLDRLPVNGRVSALDLFGPAPGGARTSEWLGTAGGSARRGPSGEPAELGAGAPISVEKKQVYLYPNPTNGDDVTLRFYAGEAGQAEVAVYNLEGELVVRQIATVAAGGINEIVVNLPGIASGMYVTRLAFNGSNGAEVRTLTLAVEK